jgi:undecaprenyl diphosphate synthase
VRFSLCFSKCFSKWVLQEVLVVVRRRAVRRPVVARHEPVPPPPHPSGARPPAIPADLVPKHVAVVMDGNGRWANARGLPRTKGHEMGEAALLDVVAGAIEIGVKHVSAYAFSTENWRRSPDEVRFLMGFNRDVIRRRRDEMNSWGVRVRWAGRRPKLWRSVISELETAEELTAGNDVLTLTMCVNYGGRAEIADAAKAIGREVAAGRLDPERIDERTIVRHLDEPDMPDVDLFLRSSGEQRTSNFLLWQSAYAELVFMDVLWPDVDRRVLWRAVDEYARRDRRYGGAVDAVPVETQAAATTVAAPAPGEAPPRATGLGWPSPTAQAVR